MWSATRGRFGVKLDESGEQVAVKAANLIPLLQAGNRVVPCMCYIDPVFKPLTTPLFYIAGSTALIHSLKAQRYNGLRCIVKKYDRSRHRYLVQLQRDGKQLSLKADNLR